MVLRSIRIAVLALAALWAGAILVRGEPLAWDEIEFFRATRWTAEGRVPFRDFWEHHNSLQWMVFAPVARLARGVDASAVLSMRLAQAPLWVAIFAIGVAIARRAGVESWGRWCALACLVTSPWLVRGAVQYRVDVLGHLGYLAAVLLIASRSPRRYRFFFAGSLLSAAVLANMRLAPLVVVTALVAFAWRGGERRWGWNANAMWIVAGGAAVATLFVAYVNASGAMTGFVDGVVWYNKTSDALVPGDARTFFARLFAPLIQRDISATLFLVAAAFGGVIALREVRRPGILQVVALLVGVSMAATAAMKVQYPYHLHITVLLMLPLAGAAFDRITASRWGAIAPAVISVVVSVALLLDLALLATPSFGREIAYQNRVMLDADRWTKEGDRVWDGCGYALRREPAYRYWFLPAGVRLMADAGLIEPYGGREMIANPPAAIVANLRTHYWMSGKPRMQQYVWHHYVPLDQNLWIPGMSALLEAGRARAVWRVPRSGRYQIYASEILAEHPWLSRPGEYVLMSGDLEIPLKRLDLAPPTAFQWRVDGVDVTPVSGALDLEAGARLELRSSFPRRLGLVIVPPGVTTLSVMPDVPFVF